MNSTGRNTSNNELTSAISVSGLRRRYGQGPTAFEAVRGLDLHVTPGTITALLGTNGAGKTSTLEVIEGLAMPSAGTVRVLGMDPIADRQAVRRRTGVLLQRSGFSGDLTVRETLQMWSATLTNPRPLPQALAMLRLQDRADVRVVALSGGEQRRLDLACALMGHPEVVLLDEPTTGLDPESRRDVWQLIRGLRDAGTTVLLTTHYLEEAESLADHLAIMHGGRIVRSGTLADISAGHLSTISFGTPPAGPPVGLRRIDGRQITDVDGITTIRTDDLQGALTTLLGWAAEHNLRLERLAARTANLESVFLEIADSNALDTVDAAESHAAANREGALR